MTRILSLACGLALAAPAAAQDRPAPPRPTPERAKAENARDLQAEVERLRAQLRELEGRLAKQRDGDRRPEEPKGERRPAPREVAPMPKEKGGERGPAPKDAGPMGRGFGPPGFGGPGGGFPPFGGPGMKDGPKGPPFGPGGFGPPPFAQGRGPGSPGAAPADFEQRLNRIIDELERLRDDLHRGPKR